jgi:phage replication O-like protein O
MSKIIPNTFQTPNILTDEFMSILDGDEIKCYLAVTRKTLGWLKRADRISKSQLADITGLSDGRITDCMKNLVSFGLVIRKSENNSQNHGIEWALELDDAKINRAKMQERAYQASQKNAQRTAKMRAGGGHVTHGGACVTEDTKAIKEDVFFFYQNNIEFLSQYNRDYLKSLIEDYTEEWVLAALKECAERNKRNLKYATAILKSWKADGFKVDTRKKETEAEAEPDYYKEPEPDPLEGQRMNYKEYQAWKAAQDAK